MTARQRQRVTPLWTPEPPPAPPAVEAWMDFALCVEVDTELFFPEKGCSPREPKSICRRCEVQVECLGYALRNGIEYGVWGGTSERERRLLKKGAAA